MAKDRSNTDNSSEEPRTTDQSNTVDTTDSAGSSQSDQHPVLGSTSNPAAEPQAQADTGIDTAPQNATQVGSATDLNAFRQELEDEVAKAHNAVDEIASKARNYVDRFQNNPQNQS